MVAAVLRPVLEISHAERAFRSATGQPELTPLVVLDFQELLDAAYPPREMILGPILFEKSTGMIHAWRGAGKTQIALAVAYAVSTGGNLFKWFAPKARKVVYIDGEMPIQSMQERLSSISRSSGGVRPAPGMLRIITPDTQDGPMPCLATADGQALVDAAIDEDTSLIIVDSISTLVRYTAAENDAESWGAVSEWALRHRRKGRAILFIHHSGKSGAQRGTSKREDILDLVINLKRPIDYVESEGARFEVHFEKARALWGEAVDPFEAKLVTDAHDVQSWAMQAVAVVDDARVRELWDSGLTLSDITREVGLHKSNVSRRLTKAQAAGELKRPYPAVRSNKKGA